MAHEPTSKAESHAGAHGAGRYWIVWAVLLCLTVLTVYTGHRSPNIVLALSIAFVKASLVVLFFMHMTEAAGANRVVFVVSLVFLVLMLLGVFGDLLTRPEMSLPSGVPMPDSFVVPAGAEH